jgi:hypothetical protein
MQLYLNKPQKHYNNDFSQFLTDPRFYFSSSSNGQGNEIKNLISSDNEQNKSGDIET